MTEKPSGSPHMSPAETAREIARAEGRDDAARREATIRLAWRPAWSIRSRRGAIAALFAAIRGEK